jgi:type I restriction enzyme S subunit
LLWATDEVVERYGELERRFDEFVWGFYTKHFRLAEVPKISLGKAAEIVMGQSPEGSSYNRNGDGMPLINGPTEFTERFPVKIQWTDKPTKICRDGDLLLCVRGSTTGRMNIANDIYCIGRGVAAIRGGEHFLTDYLEHILLFNVEEILRLSAGSTFPNIDSHSLKKIQVPDYSYDQQIELTNQLNQILNSRDATKSYLGCSKQLSNALVNQLFSPESVVVAEGVEMNTSTI